MTNRPISSKERTYRQALEKIKARVCGEAFPHWENTPDTTFSRSYIADLCDMALSCDSSAVETKVNEPPQPEKYYSSIRKGMRTLHKPELVDKAIKMANWQDACGTTVFLAAPPDLETTEVHAGQRVWFCRALEALTREEVTALYDCLIACTKEGDADGGDFTPQYVRDHLPHIYSSSAQETSPHPGPSIEKAFARSPRRVDPPGSYRDATGELVLPSENGKGD